jgi:hypothetical protein
MDALAGNRVVEVKIERPLTPRGADWTVRSEDGSVHLLVQPSPKLKRAMGDLARLYARVAIDDGKVVFIERINRSWR